MIKAFLICAASLALFMYIVFVNAIAGTFYFIHQLCVKPFAFLSASTHGFPLLLLLVSAWQEASECFMEEFDEFDEAVLSRHCLSSLLWPSLQASLVPNNDLTMLLYCYATILLEHFSCCLFAFAIGITSLPIANRLPKSKFAA